MAAPTPGDYRRRWLEHRLRHGRTRPTPTNVRCANAASVSVGPAKAGRIFDRTLDEPSRLGRPDVVAFCELADVDARQRAGAGWQVIQHGPVGSPDSALGLVARDGRARLDNDLIREGTRRTAEGGGIRDRPILTALAVFAPGTTGVWARAIKVGHAPPARAPRARAAYLRRFVAAVGSIEMGDLNIGHRWAARLLGKKVYSTGVLHVAVPRWIPSRAARVDIGSDHLALDVQLWPR